MLKDYQSWTPVKKLLHNLPKQRLFFHEREVWHCHLGENIGFEEDGKGENFLRPVIVMRKFNSKIFWGVPLTRSYRNLPFYFNFRLRLDTGVSKNLSTAILSQVRLVDARRLRRAIGRISSEDFVELKKKFKALLP